MSLTEKKGTCPCEMDSILSTPKPGEENSLPKSKYKSKICPKLKVNVISQQNKLSTIHERQQKIPSLTSL